jgi:hypothetical protein
MPLDPAKNFAKVTVSTGYDSTATTIVLASGDGAKLPNPSVDGAFNLVWWDWTTYKDPSDDPNVEIVRCTARSADTLTIIRGQEGTTASNKNTAGKTYKMIMSWTKKMRDDVKNLVHGQFILTAGGSWASSTNGAVGPSQVQIGTNAINFQVMDFQDVGAKRYAEWSIAMPSDYDGGTITAVFYWFASTTSTSSVTWGLQGRSYGDNEAIDQAWGTAQEVNDANGGNNIINISSSTPAITLAGTPAASEFVQFRVYRDSANVNDTLAATARLLAVRITYTRA